MLYNGETNMHGNNIPSLHNKNQREILQSYIFSVMSSVIAYTDILQQLSAHVYLYIPR